MCLFYIYRNVCLAKIYVQNHISNISRDWELKLFPSQLLKKKGFSGSTQLSVQYEMHTNHEFVKKATLPKKVSIVSYKGCYKINE